MSPKTATVAGAMGLAFGGAALLIQPSSAFGSLWLPVARPHTVVIAMAVVGLAAFNAIGEEILWRKVLPSLMSSGGEYWRVALVALSFGIAHLHGIPSGMTGVGLAAAYSYFLTTLHQRRGFAAVVAAHFVTDVVLFSAVAATTTFALDF
ncbi:CPBP family intramembrane glutamic endopeptidase [Demequina salsinemoris]|uniref:CPBP family intramembrane glutamic endopeptidase n=1 Tax=Demequina salsinemoris TaxID=577470 RepID=UPI0013649F23|nr:CPBP family intramembrane glutamic endopeptidase [Demequina salsinemoris]